MINKFMTIKEYAESKHNTHGFSYQRFRSLLRYRESNGFDSCVVVKMGKPFLIDVEKFKEWIDRGEK